MIRVLQVVTDMSRGGLETFLMNYYRQIDKEQFQFDFMVHRVERRDYDDEIESLGGRIYRMPKLNPFSIKYRRTIGNFFDNHPEYKIIHVHQDCLSSVILKIAYKHGIKIRIAHSHSSSQDKNIKYPIKLFFRQFIPKYATNLLACSKAAGDWMFRGASYTVLNNAIDARTYSYDKIKRDKIRDFFDIKNDEILVGHVGRFAYTKNHAFLIDIFNAIQNKIPAKLLLVGDGDLKADIEIKVTTLGLSDKIIFAGIRSDVEYMLSAMDIFVFPSVYEGLPLTVVEAQASGLPCLISDKVSIECKKTDLVQQISLTSSVNSWADIAIDLSKTERRDTYDEIRKAGFDVKENSKNLMEYYYNLFSQLSDKNA